MTMAFLQGSLSASSSVRPSKAEIICGHLPFLDNTMNHRQTSMDRTVSIYIIGAQCTGKTTLVEDTASRLRELEPQPSFTVVKELARDILKSANVSRKDIRAGSEKGMGFQRLVLEAQLDEELDRDDCGFIVSDRCGIDPIAYARLYGPPQVAEELLASSQWVLLRDRLRRGLVIVCEPVPDWLYDDGVRLMPADNEEWYELHRVFLDLLQQCEIAFEVLPLTRTSREERTAFVLDLWNKQMTQGAQI